MRPRIEEMITALQVLLIDKHNRTSLMTLINDNGHYLTLESKKFFEHALEKNCAIDSQEIEAYIVALDIIALETIYPNEPAHVTTAPGTCQHCQCNVDNLNWHEEACAGNPKHSKALEEEEEEFLSKEDLEVGKTYWFRHTPSGGKWYRGNITRMTTQGNPWCESWHSKGVVSSDLDIKEFTNLPDGVVVDEDDPDLVDRTAQMKALHDRSGTVKDTDKITEFLYVLMREHLPPGKVEEIVQQTNGLETHYCNGYLAQYAQDISKRLRDEH